MSRVRKRIELICFALYLATIFVGVSVEAIAQIVTR